MIGGRLLARASLRFLLRHPVSALVPLVGVALGVAVVLGMELGCAGALASMRSASQSVAGSATHRVEGTGRPLAPELLAELRAVVGHDRAAPVIQRDVLVADRPAELLRVLGVDPFSEARFRPYLEGAESPYDLACFLTEPGAALLGSATARRLDLETGDVLGIRAGGRLAELTVIGLLDPADDLARRWLDGLVVCDLATAGELWGPPWGLDHVDLVLPHDEALRADLVDRLARILPADARLAPAGAASERLAELTRSFRENLRALSLLSLFVGAFLVYSAVSFWVVQRRETIGSLRCVGTTRGQVLTTVLVEAAAIGVLGSTVGLALGFGLSRGLLDLVTRTINELYVPVAVRDPVVEPRSLATAFALGLGLAVVAALVPALEAVRQPPRRARRRSLAHEGAVRHERLRQAAALGAVAVSVAALSQAARGVAYGYLGLFGLLGAACLVLPTASRVLLRGGVPLARLVGGRTAVLAVRGAVSSLPRTWIATAALMAALAATTAIGIVIATFRGSVETWVANTLVADVYASPPSTVRTRASRAPIDPEVVRRFRDAPGVRDLYLYRRIDALASRGPLELVSVSPPSGAACPYLFLEGDETQAWSSFLAGEALLVSEPLANRWGLAVGDRIELRTPTGLLDVPIGGVFVDYTSSQGHAVLGREPFVTRYRDGGLSSVALELESDSDPELVIDELRRRLPADASMAFFSNRGLREDTLEVFDRTFEITDVLRLLTLVVAACGTFSALLGLALDRRAELGVLRAIGATPGQVFRLVAAWSAALGAVAGVVALPVGVLMAWVLIHFVNRPSFGWSMLGLEVRAMPLVVTVALATGIALAAALYPAWRASRVSPATALREE